MDHVECPVEIRIAYRIAFGNCGGNGLFGRPSCRW